jgi:hypothetical protein
VRFAPLLITARGYLLALLILGLVACDREKIAPPDGPGHWILVDLYHSRLQNPVDHRLKKWGYSYQGVHGYARLFDHLQDNGYPWRYTKKTQLSDALLKDYTLLFINLLHKERPDFTEAERGAIRRFVERGGGLVMIVDHSNVYKHAERANRLLEPMGVEVMFHTAVDPNPNTISGSGWIAITHHDADHPINRDVELISFQTGGTLKTPHATSTLSEQGFADLWDESVDGFYGNWKHDGDDEVEPRGKIPVVAAASYGKGRVVVVADQNIYGDTWIGLADNWTHALNVFEWAAGAEGSPAPLRLTRPKLHTIGLDLFFSERTAGRNNHEDHYTFFVHLNRDREVFARATEQISGHEDTLILPAPSRPYTPKAINELRSHLDRGKRIIILLDPTRFTQPSAGLIQALAPDFEITARGTSVRFDQQQHLVAQQLNHLQPAKLPGTHTIRSEHMKLSQNKLTSLDISHNDGPGAPYLWDVASSWGQPLVSLVEEPHVDIARVKRVRNGELIIFLQSGFWRARTLGKKETQEPFQEARPAATLLFDLLDHLKVEPHAAPDEVTP